MSRPAPAHPLAFVLVSLVIGFVGLWPVLDAMASLALGARSTDGLGSWWMQWWVAEAVSQGLDPMNSPYFFHPWGKDILLDTGGNLVDAFLTVPLRWLAGPVVAWNLLCLLILVSNGLVAGLALRRLGNAPAVVAALVAGLHPYVLFELQSGRPTQALLAPAMAALFIGARAVGREGGTWKHVVGSGLLLGLAGWTYWYAAGFVAMALGMLALGRGLPRRLLHLAGIGAVSFAVSAPAVVPLLGALESGHVAPAIDTAQWWTALFEGGSLSLMTSAGDTGSLCTLYSSGEAWMWSSRHSRSLGLAMTGVAGLLGLAAGLRRPRWVLVAVLALAIALGPEPGGDKNPLYIALAAWLPGFERLYWPCRAVSLFVPLGAVGAAALTRRAGRFAPSGRGGLAMGGVALLLLGGLFGELQARDGVPLSVWNPTVPAAYSCLAGEEGAAIVAPYGVDHEHLLHQTAHGLPLLGGMSERSEALTPLEQQALREDNTWLAAVLLATSNPRARGETSPEDRQAIEDLGFRWLLIRMDALHRVGDRSRGLIRQRILLQRLRELVGPAIYLDEHVIIFGLDGQTLDCDPEVDASTVDGAEPGR